MILKIRCIDTIILLLCGFFLGNIIGISENKVALSGLLIFVPILFFICKSRFAAFLFIFTYYSSASRGVPAGAAVFFGSGSSIVLGMVLWLAVNLLLSLIWIVFWRSAKRNKSVSSVLINLVGLFILLTLPPVGVVSWASPLVAAGYIFAGHGWLSLLLFLVCISLAIVLLYKNIGIEIWYLWWFLVIFVSLSYWHSYKLLVPILEGRGHDGWSAIDTSYGRATSGSAQFTDAFIRSTNMMPKILQCDTPFLLVPETIAGYWTPATQTLWQPVAEELKVRKHTLILGTEILDGNLKYDNSLLFLGHIDGISYRQRIPVPFSMWRPFGGPGTANAYWWESGLMHIDEKTTAAMLICYEQFLAWPFLRSMMTSSRVDLLITAANQWWSRETCIPNIERQYAFSWSLLFGLPLITARNI